MDKVEAVARELAYQDGMTFDQCHKPSQRRYVSMAKGLVEALEPCFSCGKNVWQSCPRTFDQACGREHLKGSREAKHR